MKFYRLEKPWNEDPIWGKAHKRMRISQKGILT
jgi:hypothetical protein